MEKLKAIRPFLAVAGIVVAIVVGYVWYVGIKPPPRPAPMETGRDDDSLYKVEERPVVVPPPAVEPARLATGDFALYLQGRQGEGHIARTIVLENRGQTALRIEALEVIGDSVFALVGTDGACSEIAGGRSCEARVVLSTTYPGSFRSALIARWRAIPAPAAGQPVELRVALSGDVGTIDALPDVEIPRDWAAERLRAQQLERATGRASVVVAGRATPGTGAASLAAQPDYGGFEKRVASLPVDRSRVVTTDRYIEATLETSVNSRVPGEIRAIVSRNVLGTDGRLVLIPARSKLVGRYEGLLRAGSNGGGRALKNGDTRLAVRWTRIIRPDGAHVLVSDGGYDAMGRAGLIGDVDNRLFERFFGAALVSSISFAGAAAQGFLDDRQAAYQAITQGSQTVLVPATPSRVASALSSGSKNALDRLSSVTEQLLQEGMSLEPIITIPQGTNFFVIPQADIWIPAPSADGSATTAVPLREAPGARLGAGESAEGAVFPPVESPASADPGVRP